MKLAIGSDHAGYEMKEHLKAYLQKAGHQISDYGTDSGDSTDYPDYAHPVAEAVEKQEVDLGLLLCGSGNGITMTANKHQNIRAALAWTPEIAELGRLHNNANILSLPARYISNAEGEAIVNSFLNAEFEGGRHERRVNKIACS